LRAQSRDTANGWTELLNRIFYDANTGPLVGATQFPDASAARVRLGAASRTQ